VTVTNKVTNLASASAGVADTNLARVEFGKTESGTLLISAQC